MYVQPVAMTTAMTSLQVCVLRVGSSEEGLAKALTEAVTDFLQPSPDSAAASTTNENDAIVTISNRYFDAKVALVPVSSRSISSGKEDGILLVFDDASTSDFDSMAKIHSRAEFLHQNGDLLRLCIGIGMGTDALTTARATTTTKQQEEEYSRRVLWCLDHGYEYVEKVDLTPGGIQQGHDEREKQKFARIIEAIQGTLWSTAKMHAQRKQQLQQSYQQTLENHDITTCTYEPPPTTLLPVITNPCTTDQQMEEQAKQALLIKDTNAVPLVPDNPYLKDVPLSNQQTLDKQEQDDDHIMDSMEGALKEAQRIRDLSQKGELSDDERRQRAGDAALVLMNLMNQMGGMGDDDDDEQEVSSDPDDHEND
jgi:Alpha and gamma adaptin binding protein p34